MQQYMVGKSMRFFFLFVATVMLSGIYLTGLSQIHWLLYIPASFFTFAGVSGICPGLIISKMIFGNGDTATT